MSSADMEEFYSAAILHGSQTSDSDASITVLKHLTKDDYNRYNRAYSQINGILNLNVFNYAKYTLGNLVDAMQSDMDELSSGQHSFGTQDGIVKVGVRMRNAVLAFCSALHFHQEHTYNEVKKIHGDGSKQHRQIKTIFNRLFEKSPEYRILYHTRNTMVHCTMETVAIEARAFIAEDGSTKALTLPAIDLSAIIELNDEINEKYKDELRNMEPRPLVMNLISASMPLVVDANERILRRMHPNIDESCSIIVEFDSLFEGRDGARLMTLERSTNPPPPLTWSHQAWASNVIEYAKKHAN